MKCSLCGSEFDEANPNTHAACQGCGFVKGCDLIKCPRCGFENTSEPKWLKKWFGSSERQKVHRSLGKLDLRLDELDIHERAKVSFVEMADQNVVRKIIAMGALPDTEIVLLQKFPSFVFQIGFSQFSVDRELASSIYVRSSLPNE